MLPFVIKGPRRDAPLAVALVFLVLLAAGVWWRQSGPDEAAFQLSNDPIRAALTNVIESQLAAFRDNDYERAYTFAAVTIQRQFAPADFESMVRQGYPVIAASETVSFGPALDNGREAVVTVLVQGRDRRVVRYQYLLIREGKGWKINGVFAAPRSESII